MRVWLVVVLAAGDSSVHGFSPGVICCLLCSFGHWVPCPAWGLFCSSEMLITGTWELPKSGKAGLLPIICAFWEAKISREERWSQLCSGQGLIVALINICAVICPCRSCLAGAVPVGTVPVLKLLMTKMQWKGTFHGISKHTNSLGQCGCSRITLDELGESGMTPNQVISSHFPLFCFSFLQSGNCSDHRFPSSPRWSRDNLMSVSNSSGRQKAFFSSL